MKPAPLQPFVSLLQALAREAVLTQRRLDDAWETAAAGHRLTQPRPEMAALYRAIAPARLVARSLEFSLAVRVEQGRSTGFELKAVPLNLSFATTHRIRAATSARIRLTVAAVPLAVNADAAGTDFAANNHTDTKQ